MDSNVNELVVDTRGHCFLCLNTTIFISEPNIEKQHDSVYSIQYLSSYLKLNRGKVFQGPVPHDLLEKVERSRLKVELCLDCAKVNDNLTKLFEELERIEMEIAFRLKIISDKINNSQESNGMELIKKKLESSNSELDVKLLGKLEIAKVLREETYSKCLIKSRIFNHTPKITIEKTKWKKPIQKCEAEKLEITTDVDTSGNIPTTKKIKTENTSCPIAQANETDDDYFQDIDMNSPEDDSLNYRPTETASVKKETVEKGNPKFKFTSSSITRKTISKISCKNQDLPTVPPPIKSGEINDAGSIASKRIINTDNGRHKCRICFKEYLQYRNFLEHFKSAHMNVSYTCPVSDCGKIFGIKANYKRHYEGLHMGVRLQCKSCNKLFTQKGNLTVHLKSVHKKKTKCS